MTDPSTSNLQLEYIEKRAKFKKRAEYNLNSKILDGFKQLTRCANRGRYAYDDEQVQKILLEVKQATSDLERAFSDAGGEGRRWVEL